MAIGWASTEAASGWPYAAAPYIAALLAAPFLGSLLGVLADRLPRGRTVALDRSRCDHCDTPLRARDLVPMASFAWLRGRCRHCAACIDPFVWQIEVATLGVVALALAAGPDWPTRIGNIVLFSWVLALAWCDLRWWRLPDGLTLSLLAAGLIEALWRSNGAITDPLVTDRAAGAAVGWGTLAAIAWCYRRLRGREGLGGGDAKLLAAGGAWLGVAALGPVLLIAAISTLGAALGPAIVTRLRSSETRRSLGATSVLPFGPGLAAGIALMRLWST